MYLRDRGDLLSLLAPSSEDYILSISPRIGIMYAGRDVFEAGILMALEWTRNDRRRGLGILASVTLHR